LQLDSRNIDIRAFVNDVIHFAAERIQRGDRLAPLFGQKQEAVIKAGAAGSGFLLAVFFRCHR
jgi:hypothetical protein